MSGPSGSAELRALGLGVLLPGFPAGPPPGWLLEALAGGLGGVVLFERNASAGDGEPGAADEAVGALTAALRSARAEVLVGVDEEGGDITRLDAAHGSSFPGAAALGRVDDPALTQAVAAELGMRLRRAGIGLNLAPVADVDTPPAGATNPVIGVRAYGSEPTKVARHVAAAIAGHHEVGVATAAKHFPGHGATDADSHLALPVVDAELATLRQRELVPFAAAVDAGVDVVMTAHVVYPALDQRPATLSRAVVQDLLRGELGFDGAVMTDGLDMHAISRTVGPFEGAVQALAAGVDAVCVGGQSASEEHLEHLVLAIEEAVRAGRLSAELLHLSGQRLSRLVARGSEEEVEPGGGSAARVAAGRAIGVVGSPRLAGPALVVELRDPANVAVGEVEWGIGAPLRRRHPATEVVRVGPADDVPVELVRARSDATLVVSIRNPRLRPWQEGALASLRAARAGQDDPIVVDHGPASDPHVLGAQALLVRDASRIMAEVAVDRMLAR